GVKFNDADLIGIPLRVTIGARGLKEGKLELKRRTEKDPSFLPLDTGAAELAREITSAGVALRPRA
ncbi:MAG: hypothetical protein KC417_06870, partial [Myxococcales bacterium]|nr:hypothetical protein [Myxococcales bacterium]